MIVVDTNIIVYVVVQLPQTLLAQQVAVRDPDWVVPPLWRYEFASAVTTMVRAGALTAAQAESAIAAADLLIAGREAPVDQIAAFCVAIALNLSAYDATYVALAERLGVRCVTADTRVIRNAPRIAISLDDFVHGSTTP